jgi:hypothetical protein
LPPGIWTVLSGLLDERSFGSLRDWCVVVR